TSPARYERSRLATWPGSGAGRTVAARRRGSRRRWRVPGRSVNPAAQTPSPSTSRVNGPTGVGTVVVYRCIAELLCRVGWRVVAVYHWNTAARRVVAAREPPRRRPPLRGRRRLAEVAEAARELNEEHRQPQRDQHDACEHEEVDEQDHPRLRCLVCRSS